MRFPFVGGAYGGRSSALDGQDTINYYIEMAGPNGKSAKALIGTPGLLLWKALAGAGVRGLERFSDQVAIGVVGSRVYKIAPDGTGTQLGLIDSLSTPVSMASNGTVMVIVTGPNGYVVNPALGTVTKIIDPDFKGADFVGYIDGYFLFNQPGTQKFQITNLLGTDIDALDFASAEGAPDLLKAIVIDHREVWLFGQTTTEVFFNSGNSDFPFERIPGAFIEIGIVAPYSATKVDNSVMWLHQDEFGQGMVYRAEGYTPKRVSTHAVEADIAKLAKASRIDDAIAYCYQQEGHIFYVLNFPTANRTWAYDASTGEWCKRAWRDPVTNTYQRQRQQVHMSFAGKNIVGDWQTGNLYVMDLDVYTDNGDPIPRVRRCPHVATADYSNIFFQSLTVDMEVGTGLLAGQGVDPQAMLRISNDGGKTFVTEIWQSFGKIGEYRARVRYTKLGKARDRVYELVITDPVKVVIVDASSVAKAGR
jgi:hypothetical protein